MIHNIPMEELEKTFECLHYCIFQQPYVLESPFEMFISVVLIQPINIRYKPAIIRWLRKMYYSGLPGQSLAEFSYKITNRHYHQKLESYRNNKYYGKQ